MLLNIDEIKVTDRIRRDYGNIQELAEDIKENGLINPPVVTPEHVLIAGERRLKACQFLEYRQIEVRVMSVKDFEHQLRLEISENENRKEFTFSERVEWARRLEQVEKLKAKERRERGVQENFPEPEQGRERETVIQQFGKEGDENLLNTEQGQTRDIVAQQSGFGSGKQYEKAKFIADNATKDIIKQLNGEKISINKAYLETKAQLEAQLKEANALRTENVSLRNKLAQPNPPKIVEKIVEKEVVPENIKRQLAEAERLTLEKAKLEESIRQLKSDLDEAQKKAQQETKVIEVIPEDYKELKKNLEKKEDELFHLTRAQIAMKDAHRLRSTINSFNDEIGKWAARIKMEYHTPSLRDTRYANEDIEACVILLVKTAQELRNLLQEGVEIHELYTDHSAEQIHF